MSPENQWLEDVFPIEIVPLKRGRIRSFSGVWLRPLSHPPIFGPNLDEKETSKSRGKARARIFITSLGSDELEDFSFA